MPELATTGQPRQLPANRRPPQGRRAGANGAAAAGATFRTALVNRLRAARSYAVLTLVAPPGYGKTTLLEQWASRDERPFARVSLGACDRGPRGLIAALADALVGAGIIGESDREAARSELPAAAVTTLAAGCAGFGKPSVVVVDDVHLLTDELAAVVARLVSLTPAGSTVVLAGRGLLPQLSLPRLRAAGRLLELGARDLALSLRETRGLLKTRGAPAAEPQLGELLDRTEGWAAGIDHAARSGHLDGNGLTGAFFRDVCLAALEPGQRAFLRRSSVLDRMSGPLCDAVLEAAGSSGELEAFERMGLFLVPLDHRREWYRYHHLLRDLLSQELAAEEPNLVPALHRRAAEWLEAEGDAEGAIGQAYRAGESGYFLRLFGTSAGEANDHGNDAAIEDWLEQVDDGAVLAGHPKASALAARLHAHRGRLADAERCLAAGGNDGPYAALVRAAMCAQGIEEMLADAKRALDELPRDDRWYPYGLLLQGTAAGLAGEIERAGAILSQAARAAERTGATETRVLALAERALLAEDRGSLAAAREAAAAGGLEAYPSFALTLALTAQEHLRGGRWHEAQSALASAHAALPALTAALPWLAVQTRLELAAAHVMVRDAGSARTLLAEIDVVLAVRPRLGRLRARRRQLTAEIGSIPAKPEGSTARLTGAELRLLPLLGTHLSFREIGGRLFLSRHTVKTQAISAYRKLGASSRREAVLCAVDLGLIGADASSTAGP